MALINQTAQEYYDGNDFGNYQFVSLTDIIDQFMLVYVGEEKLIPKARKIDVAFHAQRALAELSFDTLKSFKALEFTLPPSLQLALPQDYVNYTRVLWSDGAGIKHPIYPTKHTQNPYKFFQNDDHSISINTVGSLTDNSNVVVLDDDYSGKLVHGMRVTGQNLPTGSFIHNITTTSGITSITLKNKNGTADKDANETIVQQIKISRFNFLGFDRRLKDQTLVETTATAQSTGQINPYIVTVASVEDIKVGMFINHPAFVNNNDVDDGAGAIKVVGIGTSGKTVELSHPVYLNNTVEIGDTIGFVSNNDNSTTWENYKSQSPSENKSNRDDYDDDTYWPHDGERYGLEPSHAQINGSFFIDDSRGLIHFSSNLSGKTIVLDYISDSLGTEDEMRVHKLAEEAMYRCIAYAIAASKITTPEYVVQRLKKERFAAVRTAKLRLSNLKLEELTQILRGKSKWIKH